jgi:hypothetical protein
MPRAAIKEALPSCSDHQNREVGIDRVYSEVMMRCIKCTVKAKSGTSLERMIKMRMDITLQDVSVAVAVS